MTYSRSYLYYDLFYVTGLGLQFPTLPTRPFLSLSCPCHEGPEHAVTSAVTSSPNGGILLHRSPSYSRAARAAHAPRHDDEARHVDSRRKFHCEGRLLLLPSLREAGRTAVLLSAVLSAALSPIPIIFRDLPGKI